MKTVEQLREQLRDRKAAVIISLIGLASVHMLDLPGKWSESRYIAILYLGVIFLSAVLIELLVVKQSASQYFASAILAFLVLIAYFVDRTFGLPEAMDDIGNWFEPLGLLSITVEAFGFWQSIRACLIARRIRMFSGDKD
jgi:hypothetical protein